MFTLVLIDVLGQPPLAVPPLGFVPVSRLRFHARQAAAALLKMARTSSEPKVVAGLVDAAAVLKEQAGELPPPAPEAKTERDSTH
jgi:hypothetical protein